MSRTVTLTAKTVQPAIKPLFVTSPAFRRGDLILSRYTQQGKNITPPLRIAPLPANTVSLAIVMVETGRPEGSHTRWLAWNIAPAAYLPENLRLCHQGQNDDGLRYSGPAATFARHYFMINVYALDTWLALPVGANRHQLEKAMAGHVIAAGDTLFSYKQYERASQQLF